MYRHGLYNHSAYKSWNHMINRCENKNNPCYPRYGAKGVTVCERWHDLKNFIEDMGEKPEGFSIDRIDNSKGYTPENCRWANDKTQGRNRRCVKLTKELADKMRKEKRRCKNGRGEGQTRQEIADKYNVSLATVKKVLSGAYWK